jgi:hypothetical protein
VRMLMHERMRVCVSKGDTIDACRCTIRASSYYGPHNTDFIKHAPHCFFGEHVNEPNRKNRES